MKTILPKLLIPIAGILCVAACGAAPPEASKITLDDPVWNEAENAAAAGQWDRATDGYLKVMRTVTLPWMRSHAAMRVMETAPKTGRFDAVVTAYIFLVQMDVTQAVTHRPALPETDSGYIGSALEEIDKAVGNGTFNDNQKQALLTLQLDLLRIHHDSTKAGQVLDQLNHLSPTEPAGFAALRRYADVKLAEARFALDQHQYSKAAEEINASRGAFSDPVQQEDALYLLAEAEEGAALQSGDSGQIKDASLAYMRLVAHFQDVPGNRHVAASLLKTGGLLEKLHDLSGAVGLYREVERQFAGSMEASKAAESVNRLGNH